MPRQKLTQKVVDRLPAPDPGGRQVLHWDTELKGFGVLCSGTTTAQSFIVQRDLVGGRTRRVTVGPCNVLTLARSSRASWCDRRSEGAAAARARRAAPIRLFISAAAASVKVTTSNSSTSHGSGASQTR